MTQPTDVELAAFVRRVVLVLDPQYYGEEQEMLRLAAQRLETLSAVLAELMPLTTALLDALLEKRSLASIRAVADLQVLVRANAALKASTGGAA